MVDAKALLPPSAFGAMLTINGCFEESEPAVITPVNYGAEGRQRFGKVFGLILDHEGRNSARLKYPK